MSKRTTRPQKIYEVVNIHPTYESEEERKKAYQKIANDLYHIFKQHGMLKPKQGGEPAV